MKIIVNNLAVEYQDEGSGPVMLLLHGWRQSFHTFDALLPFLTPSFRVIRLGLPGFGGSELPREAWGTGKYARFVGDFCQKIGIEPEILVGHSFGGRIIIKGMHDGIFRPRKIVLIASAGLAAYRTFKAKLFLVASKVGKVAFFFLPRATRESLRSKLYGVAGSSDYLNAHNPILKATFLKAIREDLANAARSVTTPTLLIWGARDITTPLSEGKRLQKLISGSKLEVIEEAGHFVYQERPKEVADLIQKFPPS